MNGKVDASPLPAISLGYPIFSHTDVDANYVSTGTYKYWYICTTHRFSMDVSVCRDIFQWSCVEETHILVFPVVFFLRVYIYIYVCILF